MMNKLNLALIGAGQLGSRHLQGLSKLKGNNSIYILDPSYNSLSISEKRLGEVSVKNLKNSYYFLNDYSKLPNFIDLAIVATNSDVRKDVVGKLIDVTKTKNFILEKFLFQKEEDFWEVDELFKKNEISVWVNCTRRMYPEFIKLKLLLKGSKINEVNVRGSNWALGSNAIHYIDIIAFLIDNSEYVIKKNFLINEIFVNKRLGFIDFNGTINGEFANGTVFKISSHPTGTCELEIEFFLDDRVIIIKENEQKLLMQHKVGNTWQIIEEAFPTYYQSNLSNIAVEKIMSEGTSDLTPYSESMKLHLPLLKLFQDHYQKLQNKNENILCPIT